MASQHRALELQFSTLLLRSEAVIRLAAAQQAQGGYQAFDELGAIRQRPHDGRGPLELQHVSDISSGAFITEESNPQDPILHF